jgi:hypothetical protein
MIIQHLPRYSSLLQAKPICELLTTLTVRTNRTLVSFVTITYVTVMPTSSIGYWCSIAAHQYFARLQQKLAHLDITHWFYVLLVIDEGKGHLKPEGIGR